MRLLMLSSSGTHLPRWLDIFPSSTGVCLGWQDGHAQRLPYRTVVEDKVYRFELWLQAKRKRAILFFLRFWSAIWLYTHRRPLFQQDRLSVVRSRYSRLLLKTQSASSEPHLWSRQYGEPTDRVNYNIGEAKLKMPPRTVLPRQKESYHRKPVRSISVGLIRRGNTP